MELRGRRVLITGASRGIGAALAREVADAGGEPALVARSAARLERLAAVTGGRAYPADLTDPAQLRGLVERVEVDGPVDVLVNNAGVDHAGAYQATDPDALERLFHLNLIAPAELCRQALRSMLPRGRGHLVAVSSVAAAVTAPGLAAYAASKAGLSHLVAGLRVELRGTGIGTTLVELGPVRTGLLDRIRSYPPADRAYAIAERLRLLPELDAGAVARCIVEAVRHDRRHLRLPRRAAPAMELVELPRRLAEAVVPAAPGTGPGGRGATGSDGGAGERG